MVRTIFLGTSALLFGYPDVISYEVPYKTVFFENGCCAAWEIVH
jgi:hypothetical protein